MKRAVLIASAISILPSVGFGEEFSEGQRNAMAAVAAAIATEQLCPALEINTKLTDQVLLLTKLTSLEARQEIVRQTGEILSGYKGGNVSEICATGLELFGPDGTSGKNILRRR